MNAAQMRDDENLMLIEIKKDPNKLHSPMLYGNWRRDFRLFQVFSRGKMNRCK
jgi:hypothetical protein